MTRELVLAEPCTKCGAPPGQRCSPKTVLIGYHAARVIAAGGTLREYPRSVARPRATEVPFR